MQKNNLFLLLMLLLPLALAQPNHQYHLKLLAVQETPNGYAGSDADLYLELKQPGTGRVFLETLPATKFDTQISTRFAKEIACKHYQLNCDQYDFLYTIKAQTNIIGGPSAGAAIAALTTIAVKDLNYDKSISITGTINSGGIIGPVGGVKEKLEAASQAKLKKILISQGNSLQKMTEQKNTSQNILNASLNLIDYGKNNLSLDVQEVMTLDQVIKEITGVNLNSKPISISENSQYTQIMQELQQQLCARTIKIKEEITSDQIVLDENITKSLNERLQLSQNSSDNEDYYSAASFCFTATIQLRNYYYQQKNILPEVLTILAGTLEKKTLLAEKKLSEQPIETISDLQALSVVKERLADAKTQLKILNDKNTKLTLKEKYSLLAYAEERYYSAQAWMQFFNMQGKKFIINQEQLQHACLSKISEAEERYDYASIYLGDLPILNIREEIENAKNSSLIKDYPLCIVKAAQAKANSNAVLSSLGLDDESIAKFVDAKGQAVQQIIAENSAEGIFPIMGYSYYQYANTLKNTEKYTSLIYMEYALELSDLQIYFTEKNGQLPPAFSLNKEYFKLFFSFFVGATLTLLIILIIKTLRKEKTK